MAFSLHSSSYMPSVTETKWYCKCLTDFSFYFFTQLAALSFAECDTVPQTVKD